MKILLLSRFGHMGASSRLRAYQYLPYLRENGVDITVAPLLGDQYLKNLYSGFRLSKWSILRDYLSRIYYLIDSFRFDLIWVEYEILPWLPAWAEAVMIKFGIPYLVDFDDAIFHRYDLHPNKFVRLFLGNKIDKVMSNASVVVAGNEYLAERAKRAGAKRVEYLPTVIDAARYNISEGKNNPKFTIGWMGSPGTKKYLNIIWSALSEVCSNHSACLILVGSGDVEFNNIPLLEVVPWSEDTEVKNLQRFDVGIMPLTDGPWEQGKCGYKLIQYMACGLPVVASPVGVNKKIIEDGVNGFLSETTSDWVKALIILRENHRLRELMGQAGRIKVEKQYCIQVTAPRLLSLLREVARERNKCVE